jgi:protease-4
MIGGRKSGVHPLFGITMGHECVIAELRRARDDEDVAAVIFRVDSPGGVGLDSDLISHEVALIKEVKPVVVSMVDVAASGGYEISYRASKMLADSMTVTGSIGSISGKFNVREMWGKLGVTVDAVTKGPNALMNSSFSDFTPEQRARFEEDHWEGFNYWLEDVAKFRGMTFEEAEALAHGRVWTGRQAVENGLIDEVGDLHRAIEVAKELAEVPADEEVTLVHYPEKKSLFQLVTGDDGEAAAAARWAVYRQLRVELSTTWDMIEQNPDLAAEVLAP